MDRQKRAEQVSLDVLDLVGNCGFDGLQVSCKQDETHYRRLHRFRMSFGRAVPLIASDAHNTGDVFDCEDNIPYLKLPVEAMKASNNQVLSLVRHAIRYGETRFSFSTPGQVIRWISGLEITPEVKNASAFWPFGTDSDGKKSFVLPLSRNLNCLVGGRGSGKSAAIEAIAFVTDPASFEGKHRTRDEDLEDWYKRTRATLAGCHVRLVWQVAGSTDGLPKGALFSSRYFNPSGELGEVNHTNADDKEILGSSIVFEPPQIFRARQIENAAAPTELRHLFDKLVGEQIPRIEKEIADLQAQLAQQRTDMDDIALRISELTQDDAPLREYSRRKAAYEAANSPDVQPFYVHLDEAGAAEVLAREAKTRWDQAVTGAGIGDFRSNLLAALDTVWKKTVDKVGKTKPHCGSVAKLFIKGGDGLSPRDRLQGALDHAEEEVSAVGKLIKAALEETGAEHKRARETLVKKGLPPGAKDREAKKLDFRAAEEDLDQYRELLKAWADHVLLRNQKFQSLVEKCKERTRLRTETAARLCVQLGQDLDPSVLVIKVEVHSMDDKTAFRQWLAEHIGPSILKWKEVRVAELINKGIMPSQVRDSLLGEMKDAAVVFMVDKDKASDGRIEAELAETIVQKCSGKVRLEAEHTTVKDGLTPEFIMKLPPEIRDGLWTFPPVGPDTDDFVVDGVLALDEVVFDDRPEVLLNDRPRDNGSTLRPIGELSPGQRCSAILPILLLNGRCPLIIDQPEDNLDNRLIRQVIVNILASIKLRRQVIVATHNPNLPVLGDVEQAVVLRAIGEKQSILESTGNLDSAETVAHLTEIMEGGREAFQYRQSIYQAHWAGPTAPA